MKERSSRWLPLVGHVTLYLPTLHHYTTLQQSIWFLCVTVYASLHCCVDFATSSAGNSWLLKNVGAVSDMLKSNVYMPILHLCRWRSGNSQNHNPTVLGTFKPFPWPMADTPSSRPDLPFAGACTGGCLAGIWWESDQGPYWLVRRFQ